MEQEQGFVIHAGTRPVPVEALAGDFRKSNASYKRIDTYCSGSQVSIFIYFIRAFDIGCKTQRSSGISLLKNTTLLSSKKCAIPVRCCNGPSSFTMEELENNQQKGYCIYKHG